MILNYVEDYLDSMREDSNFTHDTKLELCKQVQSMQTLIDHAVHKANVLDSVESDVIILRRVLAQIKTALDKGSRMLHQICIDLED
jgi:hypothetical protein